MSVKIDDMERRKYDTDRSAQLVMAEKKDTAGHDKGRECAIVYHATKLIEPSSCMRGIYL